MEQFGGLSHLSYQKLVQSVNRGFGMTTKQISSENVEKREKPKLTQARVRELFDYDPLTGIVTRKTKPAWNTSIGEVVGAKDLNGYLVTKIDDIQYKLHRIIFLWLEGYLPENPVDHIDHNPSNNIWSNIREVSHSCNSRNCKMAKNNKSGVNGVNWHPRDKVWCANIRFNHKHVNLKASRDFTEAVAHRLAAEQALDWSGCDSNSSAYQYMQAYVRGEDMQSYLKDLANK